MAKEYIERGALIDKISKLKTGGIFTEVFKKVVLEIISNQPTADVQEVRHGKNCFKPKTILPNYLEKSDS